MKHNQNKKVASEFKTNKCWPFSLFGRWKKCVWVGGFKCPDMRCRSALCKIYPCGQQSQEPAEMSRYER